ncbi:MAG: GTP cyclohydrolase II [Kiloniellaceae bacterium]
MKLEPLPSETVTDAGVLRAVDRAIGELRRGDPVLLHEIGHAAALVLAAEHATEDGLARLPRPSRAASLLLLTARRAVALGIACPADAGSGVVARGLAGVPARAIVELADPTGAGEAGVAGDLPPGRAPGALAAAAVDLVRLARLLPAAVLAPLDLAGQAPAPWAAARDILAVSVADIAEYRFAGARALARVAEARLPLAGAENTRVVAFRPGDGGKAHLALVIGAPRAEDAVLVRLHSECFTGDLLGSLRCDCGDQLRGAIEAIAEAGAGVLLYLSQEGRGIGLVNKLRAYRLQDRGADTAEANEQLGFDADERIYVPAAGMLRRLGFGRVRLLTNNPHKVAALARCGIAVEERVPHAFPSNGHNAFYLATKAARFGHRY